MPTSPAGALAAISKSIASVETERIDLKYAGGRILAQDVFADRASPACDVSAMDGFAVRTCDITAGTLRVAGEVAIGAAPPTMPEGATLAIVTGAPVPDGAEAVIKREDVSELPDQIRIDADVAQSIVPGMNIRRRGENVSEGDLVAPKSSLISPALAGALATFGVDRPQVFRRVRIGVVITGNEVLSPAQTPTPWQLRDSHSSVLQVMFQSCAWIDMAEPVRVSDNADVISNAARNIIDSCDALVFTGGVSKGDHDHVPAVVRGLGARIVFHRLNQRPGHPALGAINADGKPILGLPGNPLSVLITARRLALPAIALRAGLSATPQPTEVRLSNADNKTLDRWRYPLIRCTAPGRGKLLRSRGSADIPSSTTSDGFVEIPPGASGDGPWAFYGWSL